MQKFDDKSKVKSSLTPVSITRGRVDPGTTAPEQFICGSVAEVDPHESVPAVLISSIAGLTSLPKSGAVFFDDSPEGERLLKLALNNADLLGLSGKGVTFVHLKGYPGAKASVFFEQVTWDLPIVAHDELVSEMVSTDRVDRMKRDEAGERQKVPRREQGLSKPRTSHFDNFQEEEVPDDEHGTDE